MSVVEGDGGIGREIGNEEEREGGREGGRERGNEREERRMIQIRTKRRSQKHGHLLGS